MRKPPHSPGRMLLRRTLLAGVVGGLALAGTAVSAQDADAVGYQDGNYGRVRFHDGGLTIVRADDDGDTRAELNSPSSPGTVWSPTTVSGPRSSWPRERWCGSTWARR